MAKPKIPNQRNRYAKLRGRLNKYALAVQDIYDKLNKEAAKIAMGTGHAGGVFKFSDYPMTADAVNKLQGRFVREMRGLIYAGTSAEWKESNLVQDLLASRVLKTYGAQVGGKKTKVYYQENSDALKAFQERADKGMNLSTKLWNQSGNYKQELEYAISSAIEKGTSAVTLSKRVSKYLNDFPQLKADYKEKFGQAVTCQDCEYRSIRLARTEINMAYRTAEQTRWRQMDFVVGYEIKLSYSHEVHDTSEVCERMAGKYPKDFVFVGWHPNCMCYVIPLLKTEDEFWADDQEVSMLTKPTTHVNEVTDVPASMKSWIEENQERIAKAEIRGTLPNWYADNTKYVNPSQVAKADIIGLDELKSDVRYLFNDSDIIEMLDGVGSFEKMDARFRAFIDGDDYIELLKLKADVARETKYVFFEKEEIDEIDSLVKRLLSKQKSIGRALTEEEIVVQKETEIFFREREKLAKLSRSGLIEKYRELGAPHLADAIDAWVNGVSLFEDAALQSHVLDITKYNDIHRGVFEEIASESRYKGLVCRGTNIDVKDVSRLKSLRVGQPIEINDNLFGTGLNREISFTKSFGVAEDYGFRAAMSDLEMGLEQSRIPVLFRYNGEVMGIDAEKYFHMPDLEVIVSRHQGFKIKSVKEMFMDEARYFVVDLENAGKKAVTTSKNVIASAAEKPLPKLIEFKKCKTVEEYAQFMKQFPFMGDVNLGVCSLKEAENMARRLCELQSIVPEGCLKFDLSGFFMYSDSSTAGTYQYVGNRKMTVAVNTTRVQNREIAKQERNAVKIAQEQYDKFVETIASRKKEIAEAIEEGWWSQERIDAAKAQLEKAEKEWLPDMERKVKAAKANFKPKLYAYGTETADSLTHEFGHYINDMLNACWEKFPQNVRDAVIKIAENAGVEVRVSSYSGLMRPKFIWQIDHNLMDVHMMQPGVFEKALGISEYAATKGAEYFAESFVAYFKEGKVADKLMNDLFNVLFGRV